MGVFGSMNVREASADLKFVMAGVMFLSLCIVVFPVHAAVVANFTGTPTSGTAPQSVAFHYLSKGGPAGVSSGQVRG
jgi:PKD repeat protein